jgi:Ca2+-binding RTX toxin-like protein
VLPNLETLTDRIAPAVTASFLSNASILTIFGDAADNTIVVSRDAAGNLLVNGGSVTVKGGTPTVANTAIIQIFGLAGNDQITLDEANGTLPAATFFGGEGNDTLTGGSSNDLLFGQAGDDTLLGQRGNDQLLGGAGNDILIGGPGTDQSFGQAGNDTLGWDPGDGSALNEGGDGIDTVVVLGGNVAETFTVTANGSRVRLDRVNPAPFFLDIGTTENLVVNLNGGDDTFTAGNGLGGLIQLTVDGGTGNDSIRGGDGNDMLLGGDGNDFIDGNQGNDLVFLGAGDDVFQWDPGDGSDTVEGGDGHDKLLFFGSNQDENFNIFANSSRDRLSRDVGNVTMDLNGLEQLELRTLGGADHVIVNDLTGTDLTQIELALRSPTGEVDGQADTIIINGTQGADNISVNGNIGGLGVFGLSTTVTIFDEDPALDSLTLNGLGGNDVIDAKSLRADAVQFTINGGEGDDVITGSDGNDLINGGRGSDTVLMGLGDDTFVWNPGDGSDIVEGQAGADTLQFNGANVNENFDLSANGSRLWLTRDIDTVTMDVDGVEQVNVAALGGADRITVNDLTGTAVTAVNLDLANAPGSGTGDNQADTIILTGTNSNDAVALAGDASSVAVVGLAAEIHITGAEADKDLLVINAQAGDDVVQASGLSASAIALQADGGDGDDVLIGGAGSNTLLGGAGDDILIGGPGHNVLDGGSGNNVLI